MFTFLSIFLARKLTIDLIIGYESMNIRSFISLNTRKRLFAVSYTVNILRDIRQDFTHSFCVNLIAAGPDLPPHNLNTHIEI
jgi:hypothetical protein